MGNRIIDKSNHCVCPEDYVDGEYGDPYCYHLNYSGDNGYLKVYFSFDGGVNDLS